MSIAKSTWFHRVGSNLFASFRWSRQAFYESLWISEWVLFNSALISDRLKFLKMESFLEVRRRCLTWANWGMMFWSRHFFRKSMFVVFWAIFIRLTSSSYKAFSVSLPWRDSTCLKIVITQKLIEWRRSCVGCLWNSTFRSLLWDHHQGRRSKPKNV